MSQSKVALFALMLAVFSTGCATASPSTTFIAPQCSTATSRDGRTVENGNAVRFDNGFDLPFTERTVTYEMPDGESKTVLLESNAQDPVRLYGGICLGLIGCLNVGNGLLTQSTSVAASSVSYGIGAALIAIGGYVALFGWRPKEQDLVAYSHGECKELAAPPIDTSNASESPESAPEPVDVEPAPTSSEPPGEVTNEELGPMAH